MENSRITYQEALKRNLSELGIAILQRRAMVGMETADSFHDWDFFRLSYVSIFNDMIAHAIKVFDGNKQSSTFWYLYQCEKAEVDSFAITNGIEITDLENLQKKLRIIRDKTHFHIDENGVLDPHKVWQEADITGEELAKGIDLTYDIIAHIFQKEFGYAPYLPDYDGSDVTEIIKCLEQHKK